ncbi:MULTISPECIES: MFS transporter [Gammaproteobacteria]|uniref:MFS transporter n=1 Tax=Gammaproteobacteria TaxID=1236 RepID=UPI000DD084F1|nr:MULTISPECIES: MFS transporter [Gammaproteobacteria]RTE85482.1 MFS transporter [Aliidiomarina sp. B3213]TCZ89450.1 MFS transporter [Lysobacter sp. N42]
MPSQGVEKTARKRELWGWAMYDVANQAYTTIVISFVYSAFFVNYIVPETSNWRDAYWSVAILGSTLVAMILSPMAGHWIDQGKSKKTLLAWATGICALFTSLLFWVSPGDIYWAIAIILVSNTAWMLGESIVSSFLPDLAKKEHMGIVSGLGWGLGYLGGFVSMVMVSVLMIRADPETDTSLYVSQHQWAMIAISIYFLVVALPTFMLVKDRKRKSASHIQPWYTSLQFLRHAKNQPLLFRFFAAFIFYMAGVQVVVKFIGIYSTGELNLTQGDLVSVFLATQFSALVGALLFGFFERYWGARRVLFVVIAIWIVAIFGIFSIRDLSAMTGMSVKHIFLGIALLAGTGIGSIQASSRSVVGLICKQGQEGIAFGLWGSMNRVAMLLAASFGVVSDLLSRQYALLLVIIFFILGGLLLTRVSLSPSTQHNETTQ